MMSLVYTITISNTENMYPLEPFVCVCVCVFLFIYLFFNLIITMERGLNP